MGNGSQAEQQDVRAVKNYDPNRPIELHSAVVLCLAEENREGYLIITTNNLSGAWISLRRNRLLCDVSLSNYVPCRGDSSYDKQKDNIMVNNIFHATINLIIIFL